MPGIAADSHRIDVHVLLSAYSCDPIEGSEPGVGWQFLRGALQVSDHVTLLTRSHNVDRVRDALTSDQSARCELVGFDLGPFFGRLRRMPFGAQIHYCVWQWRARSVVRAIHLRRPVQVAHHATFAVDWTPAAVSALPRDVAVVWGPVGGTTKCPPGLWRQLGARGATGDAFRLVTAVGRAFFGRALARRAALVIAQNRDEERFLRGKARVLRVEPNAFIDGNCVPTRTIDAADSTVIVGVGKLIGLKGWALAVRTLAKLPERYTLEIYGEGPDRRRLERLASRLGVRHRLILHGRQPRHRVIAALGNARCLLYPSLHDSAPAAVAEALSTGCPVVCLDVGGGADMVRAAGGVIVRPRRGCENDLARGVLEPVAPHDLRRWDAARCSTLVSDWYLSACGRSRARAAV